MKMKYKITNTIKVAKHGLVDYEADGYIYRDGKKIPCVVGFTDFNGVVEATHIFIKDGVTDNGTHYYAETIEI